MAGIVLVSLEEVDVASRNPLAELLRVVFVAGTLHVSHVGFFGVEGIVV